MSGIDYAARVQRGAALLDEKWPTWAQDIDLDTLDVWSTTSCVTAQYAAHEGAQARFDEGLRLLDLSTREYIDHGFNTEPDPETDYLSPEAYRPLNTLWRDLIQERRAQAQPEASKR